jgi:2-(1,2-epoxy-1,2-dihydrophenyl)acetyl-CoA isomerase
MSDPTILSAQTGAVLTLTLNRPQALNSFTGAMHSELMTALNGAADDRGVRAVVLTGSGRGFCAGQDLSDPAVAPDLTPGAAPRDLGEVVSYTWAPLVRRLRSLPIPVVCAVNGVAAGAGANLAFACDITFAARSASFIQAFARIGLIPDTGGTWLLPHLAGRARALALTLLGDKLPAEDAERFGLIWKCVDDADLLPQAQAAADKLAGLPSKALVATRHALDAACKLTIDEALVHEANIQRVQGNAHDYSEGVAAFLNKRAPVFTDR